MQMPGNRRPEIVLTSPFKPCRPCHSCRLQVVSLPVGNPPKAAKVSGQGEGGEPTGAPTFNLSNGKTCQEMLWHNHRPKARNRGTFDDTRYLHFFFFPSFFIFG